MTRYDALVILNILSYWYVAALVLILAVVTGGITHKDRMSTAPDEGSGGVLALWLFLVVGLPALLYGMSVWLAPTY
jgi:uncharacterized membrane protein YhaH (DUF805 family)